MGGGAFGVCSVDAGRLRGTKKDRVRLGIDRERAAPEPEGLTRSRVTLPRRECGHKGIAQSNELKSHERFCRCPGVPQDGAAVSVEKSSTVSRKDLSFDGCRSLVDSSAGPSLPTGGLHRQWGMLFRI